MIRALVLIVALLVPLALPTQTAQRFPAPLGLDRLLTGIVSACTDRAGKGAKPKRDPRCPEGASYLLAVGDKVYTLHGHESELAQQMGKKTLITGNALGSDVAVHSVKSAEK